MDWLRSILVVIGVLVVASAVLMVVLLINAADFARETRWWEHDDPQRPDSNHESTRE
jgi:hypothetical protein